MAIKMWQNCFCVLCCRKLFSCGKDSIFGNINPETVTITISCTFRLQSRTSINLNSMYYLKNYEGKFLLMPTIKFFFVCYRNNAVLLGYCANSIDEMLLFTSGKLQFQFNVFMFVWSARFRCQIDTWCQLHIGAIL